MTLRKLSWMYRERRRVLGELAAWHVSVVGGLMPFVNARLNPSEINPYRDRTSAAARRIQEVRDFIASRGLAALGQLSGE